MARLPNGPHDGSRSGAQLGATQIHVEPAGAGFGFTNVDAQSTLREARDRY